MRRTLDFLVALALLALLCPVILAVAVVVAIGIGRPVLFRQERSGLGGRPFTILKFRTMRPAQPGREAPELDAERLGRLGRVLRATSLDELPSLWNVLVGEMSLVGPRPLPVAYLERYSDEQARRLEVRPGITGWAQVNGRNALSWDERLALDVWYVDHRSAALDLRILWRTLTTVARRTGIGHGGAATMHEFRGPSS